MYILKLFFLAITSINYKQGMSLHLISTFFIKWSKQKQNLFHTDPAYFTQHKTLEKTSKFEPDNNQLSPPSISISFLFCTELYQAYTSNSSYSSRTELKFVQTLTRKKNWTSACHPRGAGRESFDTMSQLYLRIVFINLFVALN